MIFNQCMYLVIVVLNCLYMPMKNCCLTKSIFVNGSADSFSEAIHSVGCYINPSGVNH